MPHTRDIRREASKMALMEMNDHVDGVEALRAFNAGGVPTQYPLGINGLGAETRPVYGPFPMPTDADCAKWLDDNKISTGEYRRRGCGDDGKVLPGFELGLSVPGPGSTPAGQGTSSQNPPGGAQGTIQQLVDAAKQLAPTLGPLFKKRPKVKNVIQKEPDYTTYAVIGGAVIVASVLAIAIGKSGARRRRD